jgi:hypothetical protein
VFNTLTVTPAMGFWVFLLTIHPERVPLVWELTASVSEKVNKVNKKYLISEQILMQFITIKILNSLTILGIQILN